MRYERKELENRRFARGWSVSTQFLRTRGRLPPVIYTRIGIGEWMPYNFVADCFHTKKLCRRLSSSEMRLWPENGRFAFWVPLWGHRNNVRCSSWAHWKARIVDFLLVLIELFSPGVTAKPLLANIGSKSAISLQWGPVNPKFQVEGLSPTNHSSSQKTRLKWSFVWYKNLDRSFFRFVTIYAFDGQIDRPTDSLTSGVVASYRASTLVVDILSSVSDFRHCAISVSDFYTVRNCCAIHGRLLRTHFCLSVCQSVRLSTAFLKAVSQFRSNFHVGLGDVFREPFLHG